MRTLLKCNETQNVSRRFFLNQVGVLATLCIVPRDIFAMESPVIGMKKAAVNAQIAVENLRGNIKVLQGSGGNITLFYGVDGILMVDAGIAGSQNNIQSAIRTISKAPMKY